VTGSRSDPEIATLNATLRSKVVPDVPVRFDAATTRLAATWRITRKELQQFFFTDHDRDDADT
jgi:hypothetical protein